MYFDRNSFSINSAGTRSSIVEDFEKLLKARNKDILWQLKNASPIGNGEYQISMLKRHKFEFNQHEVIYFVSRGDDGLLQISREE